MVAGGGAQRNHRIDATNQFPPRRGGRIQGMRLKQLRSVLPSLRDGRRVGWGVIRWFRVAPPPATISRPSGTNMEHGCPPAQNSVQPPGLSFPPSYDSVENY